MTGGTCSHLQAPQNHLIIIIIITITITIIIIIIIIIIITITIIIIVIIIIIIIAMIIIISSSIIIKNLKNHEKINKKIREILYVILSYITALE